MDSFDLTDLDEPVVVTEEVIIVTEAGPYEIDMEMIPGDTRAQNQNQHESRRGNGTGVDAKYNIFPIPSSEVSANKNLVQHNGY